MQELLEIFNKFFRGHNSTAVYVDQIIEILAFSTREKVFRFLYVDAMTGITDGRVC